MNWKGFIVGVVTAIVKPREVIPARCPIDGMPLYKFDESENKRCENGHVFGPTAPRVPITPPPRGPQGEI